MNEFLCRNKDLLTFQIDIVTFSISSKVSDKCVLLHLLSGMIDNLMQNCERKLQNDLIDIFILSYPKNYRLIEVIISSCKIICRKIR